MIDFLVLLGGATLCALVILGIYAIFCVIVELIARARRIYQIKHRFDKPPTAKCYCRDCERHDNESNRCYKFDGWYTAPNWFCWDANPRKKEKE